MPADHPSKSEAARLDALRASRLLDSPTEPTFDRLTKLVTTALRVPVALVSLVDEDRQFFKSQVGLPEPWATQRQTPLSHSFCQHVTESAKPLVISDARENPLVRDNLAIRDLKVIAYAGVPIRDQTGFVLGALCAIDGKPRDWSSEDLEVLTAVSMQVSVEIELRAKSFILAQDLRRQQQLDATRQAMTRFNVHDMRTPLSALLMGLEVINLLGPLNEQQTQYVELCKQNGQSLIEMINNLLDVGNVDHRGGAALRVAWCRADDVLSAAIPQVIALAAEKAIALETDIEDYLPALSADADKVVRVLVNLIGNAIKFTPVDGTVSVRVGPANDQPSQSLQFAVQDTGFGIETAEDIFQEGVRLDQNAVTHTSTGMGLTFCKRIVEAHGGRIWFDSEVGVGSTFYFTIPVADGE